MLLSAFVRGRVHLHFRSAVEAEAALERAGFESAAVRGAGALGGGVEGGAALVHILEASTK